MTTTRRIEDGDENMGTAEIAGWAIGDRVEYTRPPGDPERGESEAGDAAWDHVEALLRRRGLELHDDGAGYVVRATAPAVAD